MLSDEELLYYNREGLIPGPEEADDIFCRRALYCLQLKKIFANEADATASFTNLVDCEKFEEKILEEAFPLTKDFFDITPSWLPLLCSNDNLFSWHGGCTWICQLNAEDPLCAFVQIRQTPSIFYNTNSVVAHEIAHVGRMAFEEPYFEELLAYRTSSHWWQKLLGPLLLSHSEGIFFLILLCCTMLFHIAAIWSDNDTLNFLSLHGNILPMGCMSFFLSSCLVACKISAMPKKINCHLW